MSEAFDVQLAARRPHVAQDGCECGPTHIIVNLLKTFFSSSVCISVCVFNVCSEKTLHLPVWPRDARRLYTPHSLQTP